MAKQKKKRRKPRSKDKKQPSVFQPGLGFTLADCIQTKPNEPPVVDVRKMLWMYYAGKHKELVQLFVNIAAEYEKFIFARLRPDSQVSVDNFIHTFLYIFTRPDFVIPPDMFFNLMAASPILNNLVAMSSEMNTDGALRSVLVQPNNFFKVLPLCTVRNEVQVNIPSLFENNAQLASLWWLQYTSGLAGLSNETTYKNARQWLSELPDKLILPDWRCTPLYFQATYIDPDQDRLIKKRMNERIQNHIPKFALDIVNTPKAKRIAIVASRWYTKSAVYKTSEPHITALKERGYDMDLVHLGSRHVDDILERDAFSAVKYVDIGKDGFRYDEIADNDYEAIYYPDIGMNNESIWLSNLRLAPVQIMGLGHPVSTFGSEVDYVITGAEVEHPELVADNYYERVVLIPGLGATPVNPKYIMNHSPKPTERDFLINCCWTAPKINYPMLQALIEIKNRAQHRVVFHFLPSWTIGRQNSAIPFLRDMKVLFGDDVLVTAEKPYHEYLEKMESGNLSLVPHPFGGYNTVVDSFAVGLPCIAIEGTKWYNRCGPGLLRRCGFEDLIVQSVEEYITKTVEIVDNEAYWLELVGRLSLVDMEKTLYVTDEPGYFADAFEYLIANHARLQSTGDRTPIRIGC